MCALQKFSTSVIEVASEFCIAVNALIAYSFTLLQMPNFLHFSRAFESQSAFKKYFECLVCNYH